METTTKPSFLALVSAFTLAASVLAPSVALAQAAAQDDDEPSTVVAAPKPQQVGASNDPNIDRGFLLPTAMTQPAGSFTYNNYELLLHGLTYGITDNVQASVTVLSPIVRDMPFFGSASVKARLAATQRLHLALQGSASFGHFFDDGLSDGSSSSSLSSMGAGAFASVCLRDDCSSIASVSATYQLAMSSRATNNAHLIIYGGSIVHRITPRLKLLGEVASAAASAGSDAENIDGVLASYGVRFHSRNIAGDIGFMRPIGNAELDDGFLMGLPFVNFSYRWQ